MLNNTPSENKLHDLSPALRNQGPDSHKDNSKQMGKMHSDTNTTDDKKKSGEESDDASEGNEDNA